MKVLDEFRDEDLTAYLDGEAEAQSVEAIDAALTSDPALRRRLDELRPLTDDLTAVFAPLLAEAPEMPLLPEPTVQKSPLRMKMIGGFAACLLAGALIGWQATERARSLDWMDYVAAYQALYVNGTLASVSQTADQKAARLATFSETLGRDLTGGGSDTVLDFKRSQLLGFEGQPLIQLAYLSPVGAPVALCIIKAEDAKEQAITISRLEGMSAAYWTEGGHSFLLIGGQDDALIKDAAHRLAERI